MSDNIDYAELDRAVNEAIKNRPKMVAKPVQHSHGQYMDFVSRRPAPIATKPVATATPRPAVRPVANPAVKPVAKKVVAKPVARPTVRPVAKPPVAKPVAKQAARPAARPVSKPVPKPAAKPAPKPAPKIVKKPEPSKVPNANNYSLGVRSPFLTDAKVEKRPLGTDIPETSAHALRSTKNVYSSKSPSKATKTSKKHLITEAPKKHSGWLWTLVVLLVIAAGGGLGYLAYILVFAK